MPRLREPPRSPARRQSARFQSPCRLSKNYPSSTSASAIWEHRRTCTSSNNRMAEECQTSIQVHPIHTDFCTKCRACVCQRTPGSASFNELFVFALHNGWNACRINLHQKILQRLPTTGIGDDASTDSSGLLQKLEDNLDLGRREPLYH
jgi:hypothetical protein